MNDLPLQIARVDDIEIDEAEGADSRRGQIQGQRRTESAGADTQHLGGLELLLAFHADFGQDQVARVARDLFIAQLGQLLLAPDHVFN